LDGLAINFPAKHSDLFTFIGQHTIDSLADVHRAFTQNKNFSFVYFTFYGHDRTQKL